MMAEARRLLAVEGLEVQFNTDEGTVRAVNGISYALEPGGALGIVGESGCGKSVSSLAVMGLVPQPVGKVVAGSVEFQGQDLLELNPGEMREIRGGDISMIFQDPMSSLNPVLTVGFQIQESLRLHLGMDKKASAARAVELLDMVGIPSPEDRVKDYPHQLSGGMQQRVMIAMAISCQPKLLFADEPSTALDVTIEAQVIELLGRLRKELGMAVVLITHDLAVVAGFCEEVVVMYAGYIVEQTSVREIFHNPRHPYTIGLLGSMPGTDQESGRGTRLNAIQGSPPDLTALPDGCPFAPRCTFVQDRCRTELPELEEMQAGHAIRCFVDVETGEAR
jgi:oligopeptide transport system ATP-binding protein